MGLGGMKYAWQRQTKDFAHTKGDQYSSLVFDNRGIGDSDKPRSRYSTSEMAKDIVELVDHIGWTGKRELHVIGISMGGMIAQELVSPFISGFILSHTGFQCFASEVACFQILGCCTFRSTTTLSLRVSLQTTWNAATSSNSICWSRFRSAPPHPYSSRTSIHSADTWRHHTMILTPIDMLRLLHNSILTKVVGHAHPRAYMYAIFDFDGGRSL
jgi:hypothetical protein